MTTSGGTPLWSCACGTANDFTRRVCAACGAARGAASPGWAPAPPPAYPPPPRYDEPTPPAGYGGGVPVGYGGAPAGYDGVPVAYGGAPPGFGPAGPGVPGGNVPYANPAAGATMPGYGQPLGAPAGAGDNEALQRVLLKAAAGLVAFVMVLVVGKAGYGKWQAMSREEPPAASVVTDRTTQWREELAAAEATATAPPPTCSARLLDKHPPGYEYMGSHHAPDYLFKPTTEAVVGCVVLYADRAKKKVLGADLTEYKNVQAAMRFEATMFDTARREGWPVTGTDVPGARLIRGRDRLGEIAAVVYRKGVEGGVVFVAAPKISAQDLDVLLSAAQLQYDKI